MADLLKQHGPALLSIARAYVELLGDIEETECGLEEMATRMNMPALPDSFAHAKSIVGLFADPPQLTLDGVKFRTSDDEDHLYGTVELLGTSFHVEAIKVTETEGEGQAATRDPHDKLDDLFRLCGEGAFHTVQIRDHPGDWVLYITPFQQ